MTKSSENPTNLEASPCGGGLDGANLSGRFARACCSAVKYILLLAVFASGSSCASFRSVNLITSNSQQTSIQNFTDTIDVQFHYGRIIVPVEIAGKTRRFMLDTGAGTTISKSLAEELNYQGRKRSMLLSWPFFDRKVRRHSVSPIEKLKLGNITFENVWVTEAVERVDTTIFNKPCDFFDGLLGSDLLNAFSVKLDMQNRRMILSDNSLLTSVNPAFRQPMEITKAMGYPKVEISAQGQKKDVLFDTGFSRWGSLNNFIRHLEKNQTTIENEQRDERGRLRRKTVRFNELTIGDISIQNVSLRIPRKRELSVIGASILYHAVVILDYKNSEFAIIPYDNSRQITVLHSFGVGFFFSKNNELVIHEIGENSPAERAGLKIGFRIKEIDEFVINAESRCELFEKFDFQKPTGNTRKLLVVDLDGNEKEIVLTRN